MARPDGWPMIGTRGQCYSGPRSILILLLHLEPGQRALLSAMRDDYYKDALEIVDDPYVLANMIWARVQMLRRGNRPLVESCQMLSPENVALREIIEGKITQVSGYLVVLGNSVVMEDLVKREDAVDMWHGNIAHA
jgi:DNA-directed RNA polymerase subunit omega